MNTTATTTETMKAVRIHSYGGPEVLRYEDAPRPEPREGQVLVRVHAAGVNPVDWKIRKGLLGNLPFPQIMGNDFSGVVEALGPNVGTFRVGEAVFGGVADDSGSYAEYAAAPITHIAEKPGALDHVHAAAIPVAGITAWQALFDTADLKPGQKVLIHAASGGVGNFAVQFAKWKDARVIGTASAQNERYVRDLGVDQFIDYRGAKFEEVLDRDIDVVLDTIGGGTQERSWQVLKPGGILVSIVQPPDQKKAAEHGVRGVFMVSRADRGDELEKIATLVTNRQVKVNVETVLPLKEARMAQELSESGHTRGKIVLVAVSHPD